MQQDLSIAELKKITEIIKDRFDLDFREYAMSSFKRRIIRILEIQKIPTVDALCALIENGKFTKEELLHEITVNVTEMFRDPSFWRAIKTVLPNLFLNHDKIRIWHAGCSSGEEVYSMLIVLAEIGVLDKTEIIASDIDKNILSRAKEGKILVRNMDLNEKNYQRYNPNSELKPYFNYGPEYAELSRDLLDRVSFREINLVETKAFTKCDLILCRNVMIYFNQTLQNQVIKLFHEMLFTYGYLAIGSKESIIWSEHASKFIVVNNEEKIYKKFKD